MYDKALFVLTIDIKGAWREVNIDRRASSFHALFFT
jgi:hypothetical protein